MTIPAEPARIVSLSPSITETLFALGAGPRVVGGTDFDDYPKEAAALPDVATFEGVNVEAIVGLDADLVIAQGDLGQAESAARLRSLGIPAIVLVPAALRQALDDISLIGRAVGEEEAASRVTGAIDERIDAVRMVTDALAEKPRVFYELGYDPQNIYGLTNGSITADMVEIAGGDPITTGSATNAVMPLERLVQGDPQVIVLGDAQYIEDASLAGVRARGPAWQGMTAVKEGEVRAVDDIIVTRPGPRLGEGLVALARAIDPDIVIPSPAP